MSVHEYLETVCNSILDTDKNIQSVVVISRSGKVIEKNTRSVFAQCFPDHPSEMFCMHHVLQVSMGREFDDNYGPVNYHISERENLMTLTFPLNGNVLLVTTNKEPGTITLARQIACVIHHYNGIS